MAILFYKSSDYPAIKLKLCFQSLLNISNFKCLETWACKQVANWNADGKCANIAKFLLEEVFPFRPDLLAMGQQGCGRTSDDFSVLSDFATVRTWARLQESKDSLFGEVTTWTSSSHSHFVKYPPWMPNVLWCTFSRISTFACNGSGDSQAAAPRVSQVERENWT